MANKRNEQKSTLIPTNILHVDIYIYNQQNTLLEEVRLSFKLGIKRT